MKVERDLYGDFREHVPLEIRHAHSPIGPSTGQIVSSLQGKEFLYV
jgi:hypothetical protein